MSKGNRTSQTNRNSDRFVGGELTAAMEETLKLCHAWLGYLLTLRGEEVIRVKAEDIKRALETLSCAVSREGDEYVIRLRKGGEAVHEENTECCNG